MRKSIQRLGALIRKETTQLLRDRRLLIFIFGLPILELFLYGYAAHMTVYHIPLAVADQSRDSRSQAFVRALVDSQYFDWTLQEQSQDEVVRAIGRGQVRVGVVIPPGFDASLARGNANVLILLDGTDTASVQSGYGAANLVAQNFALQLTAERVNPGRAEAGNAEAGVLPITTSTRVLYNPDLIDIWFLLPGLIGIILQTLAIQQSALIVVRERELGTIEQILVTPTRPLELIVSKMIPVLALSLLVLAAVVGIGVFWFGVPFQGSLLLYFGLAVLFIASCLGLGLLVSTQSKSQMEAYQNAMLFMLIGMLMSGFLFPQNVMPLVPRLIGDLVPLTYFIRISRGIFTKGVGMSFVWSDALVLAFYTVVVVVVAARSFKRRLD